jgi:hypothetical protein
VLPIYCRGPVPERFREYTTVGDKTRGEATFRRNHFQSTPFAVLARSPSEMAVPCSVTKYLAPKLRDGILYLAMLLMMSVRRLTYPPIDGYASKSLQVAIANAPV